MSGLPDYLVVLGRGLALLTAAAPGAAAGYLALTSVVKVLPVAQVWLTKLLVDQAAAAAAGAPEAIGTAVGLASLYTLTLVLAAGLQPLQQSLQAGLEDRAVAEVDRRVMQAGIRLADLYRIERPAFQDEARLALDGAFAPSRLFAFVYWGLSLVLTVGGLLILLSRLHPLLPLALAALSVPHLVASWRVERLKYRAMADRSRAAREMDYCARVATAPAAAKELRVFGLGEFFRRRFRDRFTAAFAEVHRLRLSHLRLSAAFGGLYALALAGGFWYVAAQAGAGRLTLGDVALYLGAVMQAQGFALSIGALFSMTHEIILHLRGLFRFLDSARPMIALPQPGQGRPAPAALSFGIELRGVRFRYPEGTSDVLEAVTALLPAGQVTALVGANGAGKSTLVKLLTRMYDPTQGEILLDGAPLQEYDLASLRRRIAVVYQDFARFSLTLRENIAVGRWALGVGRWALGSAGSEHPTPNTVKRAAAWAGADAVAAKLPQGYDTQLTRRFQGGVELSGGEWQTVALARGFVRDAALVILDEPTAALDAEAEYALFQRFRELVVGKTALLISHRFSTVRMADHILVLEGGRIVEAGSHPELLALGGRYATLFGMQAGRYR